MTGAEQVAVLRLAAKELEQRSIIEGNDGDNLASDRSYCLAADLEAYADQLERRIAREGGG